MVTVRFIANSSFGFIVKTPYRAVRDLIALGINLALTRKVNLCNIDYMRF